MSDFVVLSFVLRTLHMPVRSSRSRFICRLMVCCACTDLAVSAFSTKSVITKPQNVYVLRDVMCSGYVAGANCQFFGATLMAGATGAFDPAYVEEAITKRLAFQDDATGEYESMLAFAAPFGDGAKRDQVISITDRLLPWEVNKNGQKEYFPGEQDNYTFYRTAYGLHSVHFGEDIRAAENMEFISQVSIMTVYKPKSLHFERNSLCHSFCSGLYEQRALLRGPAPQVQPVRQSVPRAGARSRPLWSRRHPGSNLRTPEHASCLQCTVYLQGVLSCGRTQGGDEARPCRSRQHATPWSAWRWLPTPSYS